MKRRLGQARSLIRLSHRHVARVFDTGFDERGQLYIVTELVSGTDLKGWLRQRPRAWTEIISVFRRIARGLAAAHGADVVHGDLRASNLLIGDGGRVCVADFGGPVDLIHVQRRDDVQQLCERLHSALRSPSAGRVPASILRVVDRGRRAEIETMEALLAGLDKPNRMRAMLVGPAVAIGILIGLGSAYALAG
jgi:serine/threonine protein kinase